MYDLNDLKNKIAVIGVGNTKYGNFPELDDYGLAAHAFRNAVNDCGIDKNKIDGMLVSRIPYYARMGEVLGINPRWTITLPGHGRMSGMGIIEAANAIATGQCDYAALMYANIGRSRRVNYGGDESPGTWDPWGFTSPGAAHAMMFRRHMELYGTTTRQLAEVSVAIRYHAGLNPDAVMRNPISIEDHESARFITAPLRLLDYCLINDGAVCLILTSKERARDFKKPPVLISGWLYVFVLSIRELGASIFLVGPGTHVLSTITLTMWEEGDSYGAVCALSIIQIVPLIAIVAALRWVESMFRRRLLVDKPTGMAFS